MILHATEVPSNVPTETSSLQSGGYAIAAIAAATGAAASAGAGAATSAGGGDSGGKDVGAEIDKMLKTRKLKPRARLKKMAMTKRRRKAVLPMTSEISTRR